MERIAYLLSKLKSQYEQKDGTDEMLATVQLLQFELTRSKANPAKQLGTSKVAVILPAAAGVLAGVSTEEFNKYAPQPQAKEQPAVKEDTRSTKETKETLLVEDDSVSVVQKNGQLDMVFDPLADIPTLAHQQKELNDSNVSEESLNDKLRQAKTELVERLKETPVKDLRKAIGINDRFLFINELFHGDESTYERSIKTINNFNIYPEAEYWINRELKVKLGWNNDNSTVKHFDQLVKRRFS